MADTPTFVFDDDGKAYAYLNGKVVAAAADADELEAKLAYDPMAPGVGDFHGAPPEDNFAPPEDDFGDDDYCPDCQGSGVMAPDDPHSLMTQGIGEGAPCPTCGGTGMNNGGVNPHDPAAPGQGVDPLPAASPDTLPGDDLPPRVTHVETPNGLKGQILGKVKGLWGDQVTIRLENGRIAKFDVTPDLKFTDETTSKTASTSSPIAALEDRLNELPDGTKSSLRARLLDLKTLKREASSYIRTASYTDQIKLDQIVVTADLELREVTDALAALEDAEPYAPPAPFNPQVMEQESMGGGDATWLDNTLGEMISEAEATDFDQMMEEEPSTLVAEMETPALEDAQGVQEHALAHVNSKTAGLDRDAVADFKREFLQRVEAARKLEMERRGGVLPVDAGAEAVQQAMSAIKREYITSKTPEAKARYEQAIKEYDTYQSQGRTASVNDADGPAEGLFF